MDFLGGLKFHAGENGHIRIIFRRDFLHRRAVTAGVMVTHGDHIQTAQRRHVDDVVRGHFLVAAGREAVVDVKVVIHSLSSSWVAAAIS